MRGLHGTLAVDSGYRAHEGSGAPHKPGEIRVEYADDRRRTASRAKLRHPSFGVGEVRAWQGAGNDMKVTMRFAGVGVKTILARFLSRP